MTAMYQLYVRCVSPCVLTMGTRAGIARRFAAYAVDLAHVALAAFLCLGWAVPTAWLAHVLTNMAVLAGWAGFGVCPLSLVSARLRGSRDVEFLWLRGFRSALFAPFFGRGGRFNGECDVAGVVVLCASACVSLQRGGHPGEAAGFAALTLSGYCVCTSI